MLILPSKTQAIELYNPKFAVANEKMNYWITNKQGRNITSLTNKQKFVDSFPRVQ